MKRLSRNILLIVGSDVGRRALGFVAVAYLARTVGLAGFGLVNIGFAVLSYAVMASSGGLGAFGARAIARGEPPSIASSIVGVRLVSSCASFLAVAAVAFLFVRGEQTAALIVVFSLSVFASAFLLDWYFQGKEQMGVVGASRLISAAVYLLFLLLFVHSPADLLWVAVSAVAGDIMASLVTIGRFGKETGSGLTISVRGGAGLFREAMPIGLGSIIAHVTVNLPTLVVGIFLSNEDAGIYSAAAKLVFFLLVFDRLLAQLLLPASSRYFAEGPERLAEMLSSALRWVLRIALPLCVGGTILADRIIPLVYGASYAPSADVFRILLWFLLLTMVHTVYTAGLIASGQEKRYGRVMLTSAVWYVVSILACTWYYGVAGAAVAIVVAELATVAMMRHESRQFVPLRRDRANYIALAAAAAMGGTLVLLPQLHVLLCVAIGAGVYGAILFALRGIALGEFSIFLKEPA